MIANRGMLSQMGWLQAPTRIEEDNKACVDASIINHMTRGLRYLEITENFLKEKYADGTCVLVKIASSDNWNEKSNKTSIWKVNKWNCWQIIESNKSKTKWQNVKLNKFGYHDCLIRDDMNSIRNIKYENIMII